MDLDRAIRLGAPHPALRAASPSAGRRGARFGRRGGGRTDPYSPAASAAMLPQTAIWIATTDYLGLADGNTTVDTWLAGWGGIRPTLTAPAATNRPAYSPTGGTGGRPLVTFDGADNCLGGVMTKGSDWTSHEVGMVGSRVAYGAGADMAVGIVVGSVFTIGTSDHSIAAMRSGVVGLGNAATTSDPDGNQANWSGDHPGGTAGVNARKNGTIENTGVSGAYTPRADGSHVCLGGNSVGLANFGNWAFMAAYAGPSLTADQRAYLRALLTYHTGVAS